MILNQAKDMKLGSVQVKKLYLGSQVIWEKGGGVPSNYQAVEYLQSTGTQYIDTGLRFDTSDYHYIVDCVIDNYNGNQMFGMKVSYDHGVDVYYGVYQLLDSNSYVYDTTIPAGQRATFTIDKPTKTIYADSGNTHDSHTFPGDFSPGSSVYRVVLFACWSSWSDALSACGIGKIYRFKYYSGGELLADMVPCYRKSDDKPGMYDLVRQIFITNSGTGEFTLGPDLT